MLVAAAEPSGDPELVLRAARQLDIERRRAQGLPRLPSCWSIGARVQFRHPLVRSAVYRAAPPASRQRAHEVLAEVSHPDSRRRSARVAPRIGGREDRTRTSPPSSSASAGRAQARGGVAATAAFLQRAVALTPDPAPRASPCARGRARQHPGRRVQHGSRSAGHSRGRAARRAPARADRPAARPAGVRLQPRHRRHPAPAGRRPQARTDWTSPSRARRTSTRSPRRCSARRLNGSVGATRDRRRPPAPRSADAFNERRARDRGLAARRARLPSPTTTPRPSRSAGRRWSGSPATRRRPRSGCAGCGRAASSPSRSGTTNTRPRCRAPASRSLARRGRSASLRSLSAPARPCSCSAATSPPPQPRFPRRRRSSRRRGSAPRRTERSMVSAWRGRQRETTELIETTEREAGARGEGIGLAISAYARAVLCNGLGRYEDALAAAVSAVEHREVVAENWGLSELVEAATRCGRLDLATDALNRLAIKAEATGTALGARHRGARSGAARATAPTPTAGSARRSTICAALAFGPSSPARICCTASGCGARVADSTRAPSSMSRTSMFVVDGHGGVRQRAASELVATGEKRRRPRPRDPDDPHRPGTPDRRAGPRWALERPESAPACSSARARSSGTCATSTRSSQSDPGASWEAPSGPRIRRPRTASRG